MGRCADNAGPLAEPVERFAGRCDTPCCTAAHLPANAAARSTPAGSHSRLNRMDNRPLRQIRSFHRTKLARRPSGKNRNSCAIALARSPICRARRGAPAVSEMASYCVDDGRAGIARRGGLGELVRFACPCICHDRCCRSALGKQPRAERDCPRPFCRRRARAIVPLADRCGDVSSGNPGNRQFLVSGGFSCLCPWCGSAAAGSAYHSLATAGSKGQGMCCSNAGCDIGSHIRGDRGNGCCNIVALRYAPAAWRETPITRN